MAAVNAIASRAIRVCRGVQLEEEVCDRLKIMRLIWKQLQDYTCAPAGQLPSAGSFSC